MRFQFLLVPAAVIVAAQAPAPAQAKVYLTVKQAQALLFPNAVLKANFVTLTEGQADSVQRAGGIAPLAREVKAWRTARGEWFILDQVHGKDDLITYAVALDAEGAVRGVEILECLADYDTITMPEWRAQFNGRVQGDRFINIEKISGSTLSSRHISEGVKRTLAVHALVLEPSGT